MNPNFYIIKFLFVLAFISLVSASSVAQYRFVNYDYSHGLPISSISNIAEDSLGFLWLGSNNGLVRFDGVSFHQFESKGDDPSAPFGSEIAEIVVAQNGKVWITFHEGGISIYDPTTQKFQSRFHTETDGTDFPRYAILNCTIDKDSNKFWMVSSSEGVFVMDMNTLESKNVISTNVFRDIVYDPAEPDFIYVSGDYIIKINKKTLEKHMISNLPLSKLIKKEQKLYGYDWSSNTYSIDLQNNIEAKFPIGRTAINRALMIHNNHIWLGNHNGIKIRDIASGDERIINRDQDNLYAIANHNIFAFFKDKSDRIWIGTGEGLSAIIPQHQKLTHFQPENTEAYSDIISAGSTDKYYLISLYDNLIQEINLNTNNTSPVYYNTPTVFNGPIKALRSLEKTWVLFYKGFGYFTDQNKTVVKHDGGQYDASLQNQDLGDMVLDDNGYLWLSRNRSNIIYKISTKNSSVIDTFHLSKLKSGEEIKVLHWNDSILWIGTDIGICRYDTKTENKKWMSSPNESHNNILEDRIEDLRADREGNLWVLSLKRGAWKCTYDPEIENITIIKGYSKEDGLPNNRPWRVELGNDESIFFGSNSGLSVYLPQDDRMVSFNKQFGFPNLSLSPKLIGERLFILSQGLSYFTATDLPLNNKLPVVHIQSISVSNQKIIPPETSEITFSYKENDVAIDYIAIDLSFGREITYRYRINEDNSWSEVDFSQRKAIFNKLPPGDYTFEIAAAGNNMIWGQSSSISFSIIPPFWKKWWFRLLCLLAFILLSILLFQYRMKRVKRISEMKTRMAELENEALRAQMNPHFIFNSLNSIKSFIIHNKREEAADYLTVFSDLIRVVLNNSKKRFISLADEKEALDLYMEIENIRLEDKFTAEWNIEKSMDLQSIIIPPLTIQPFVENAIWHGFVHKEGKGNLKISIAQENDLLFIVIKDDGVGRVRSKEIEKRHPRKRSFGIEITEQRLDYGEVQSEVIINDLYDEQRESLGTEVILKMPVKYSTSEQSQLI